MVERLLLSHDDEASVILGISLNDRLLPDRGIWGLTPSGMFSSSSAYKMLVAGNGTNIADSSNLMSQELLAGFLQVKEDFRKEIFVMVAWCLWSRHNALKFGHPMQPIASICSRAGNLLQEFLSAQDNNTPAPVSAPIPQ